MPRSVIGWAKGAIVPASKWAWFPPMLIQMHESLKKPVQHITVAIFVLRLQPAHGEQFICRVDAEVRARRQIGKICHRMGTTMRPSI